MRAIGIDLSPFAPWPSRRSVLMLILLGLAVCATALKAWLDSATLADLQQKLGRMERTATQTRAPLTDAPLLPEPSIKAINEAIRHLNFEWHRLFDIMDSHALEDVTLLALEPSDAGKLLKILAEARSLEAMADYLQSLSEDERLNEVVLTHHEVAEQDVNRPIRFSIEARWGYGK